MLGVFQIKTSDNLCCYFVKRPFGNLLLFASNIVKLESSDYNLMSSYGGLFKILLESTEDINDIHGTLFTKYGASAICDTEKEHFDPRIKVERLKDFIDPGINFIFYSRKNVIILKQDNKNIMFVGNELKLLKDKSVTHNNQLITDYLSKLQLKYKVDLIYFTSFETDSVLTFKDNIFTSMLKKLNNKG